MAERENPTGGAGLSEWIIEDLKKSGLTPTNFTIESIESEEEIQARLGFTALKNKAGEWVNIIEVGGYWIPYSNVPNFYRLKLRYPVETENGTVKYLSPKGAGNHAYILPEVEELLKNYNPDKPVFVTEGEKKAAKGTLEGFPTIGLGGVWSFKDTENDFLPELEKLVWTDRRVYLCFDSDITEKQPVRHAELRLAIGLISHGAVVYSIRLPNEPDGSKNGLDDYLVRYGPEEFRKLIENAKLALELHINSSDIRTERLIEEFSRLKSESEKDRWLRLLGKKRGISYRAIIKDIGRYETQEATESTKKKYTACFSSLVDLVEDENGSVVFFVKTESGLAIKPSVEVNGEIFFPPPREKLPFKFLPRAAEVIKHYDQDTDLDLLNDLTAYFQEVSDLPLDGLYYLIAVWVMHTYLMENFDYSPYLWFFGIPERGKTRTGKAISLVAYRGVHVESLRDAYLIRLASDLKATFFFDVIDIWRKAERAGSEDLLLQRFERGAFVARVLYPEKGAHEDTVFYDIFGPTVVATNEGIHPALESRAITITMKESSREFGDIPVETAISLRERLVAFRARHLGNKLPEAYKPAKGRFGDILKPLMRIVLLIDPAGEQKFQRIIAELEQERKEQKSDSLDAQLILVLAELEREVKSGLLSIQFILNRFNETVDERLKTTNQRLGWHLRKLGFRKRRQKDGTYIEYDRELLDRLKDKFGLKMSEKNLHHLHHLHQANNDAGFRGEDLGEDFANPENLHQHLHHENPHKYWPGVNDVDGEVFFHEINENKNEHNEAIPDPDLDNCEPPRSVEVDLGNREVRKLTLREDGSIQEQYFGRKTYTNRIVRPNHSDYAELLDVILMHEERKADPWRS